MPAVVECGLGDDAWSCVLRNASLIDQARCRRVCTTLRRVVDDAVHTLEDEHRVRVLVRRNCTLHLALSYQRDGRGWGVLARCDGRARFFPRKLFVVYPAGTLWVTAHLRLNFLSRSCFRVKTVHQSDIALVYTVTSEQCRRLMCMLLQGSDDDVAAHPVDSVVGGVAPSEATSA